MGTSHRPREVTVIVGTVVAFVLAVGALTTVLARRDRGRDRSADRPPELSAEERALSQGVPGYLREQGGPWS